MKALTLTNISTIKYTDASIPELSADEVLVKVHAAGICGSDIPRAYRDGAHKMPLILGHEFSGEVIEAGSPANSKWINEKVAVFPLIPCMKCPQCQKGHYEMCHAYDYLGSRSDGGFAEYVKVPAWNLIKIPENVSYEAAAMLEPMAVAVHAMRRTIVSKNDTVIVSGLGTIGTLLTMFLLEAGVENIFVIGNHDFQKDIMADIGIDDSHFCDIRSEKVSDFVTKNIDNEGASVYFECVGSNDSICQALDVVAPSGRICYVGNPHTDISFDKNTYWKILRKQLIILGTWNSSFCGGDSSEEDDWKYVINRLAANKINPQKLITHKFSLDNLQKGMEIMRDKSEDYIKIMCIMD